jgi:hypothetical protein
MKTHGDVTSDRRLGKLDDAIFHVGLDDYLSLPRAMLFWGWSKRNRYTWPWPYGMQPHDNNHGRVDTG